MSVHREITLFASEFGCRCAHFWSICCICYLQPCTGASLRFRWVLRMSMHAVGSIFHLPWSFFGPVQGIVKYLVGVHLSLNARHCGAAAFLREVVALVWPVEGRFLRHKLHSTCLWCPLVDCLCVCVYVWVSGFRVLTHCAPVFVLLPSAVCKTEVTSGFFVNSGLSDGSCLFVLWFRP